MEMAGVTVTRTHSDRAVLLERVDWRVSAGDFWVVGGLHRAGKSALLATAVALQPPKEGVLTLFGVNVADLDQDALLDYRLRAGMVFENGGSLFSHLTLAENVALPLRYHRNFSVLEAEGELWKFLEAAKMTEMAHTRSNLLSRDFSQRAALLRALILKPDVLFLDNPITGLDPRERFWWFDFLAGLAQGHALLDGKPLTLVVATDDLRPWVDRGRQFACIDQRHFLCLGWPKELNQSHEPLIRELLATG